MSLLPNKELPCDICQRTATRWFKETAVPICDSPECFDCEVTLYAAHALKVNAELAEEKS